MTQRRYHTRTHLHAGYQRPAVREHLAGVDGPIVWEDALRTSVLNDQLQALSTTLSDKLDAQEEDLSRLQTLVEEHRDDQEGWMTTLVEKVEQIQSVLQDAELVSRLERITDSSKSASQAAQNSLSRLEAVERNLGQSISRNHDQREDAEDKIHEVVAALKTRVYGHMALSGSILAVLVLEVLGVI